MRCPGCCNPEMLDDRLANQRPVAALLDEALAANVEGLSFLGGEPFYQAEGFAELAEGAQDAGLSVMVFTGYTLAELEASEDPHAAQLLAHTDLLVDGRYDETKRTQARRWIGSENQVLHFLTSRYDPEDPQFSAPNTLEIRMVGTRITLNGFPVDGARTDVAFRRIKGR